MKDQKTIYVHQTVTLWSENGEVYMETDTGNVLVFNATSLFEDIPHLFSLALKERRKQEEMIKDLLKETL